MCRKGNNMWNDEEYAADADAADDGRSSFSLYVSTKYKKIGTFG